MSVRGLQGTRIVFVFLFSRRLLPYAHLTPTGLSHRSDLMSGRPLQNVFYAFYIAEFKQADTLKQKGHMSSLLFLQCLVNKDKKIVVLVVVVFLF